MLHDARPRVCLTSIIADEIPILVKAGGHLRCTPPIPGGENLLVEVANRMIIWRLNGIWHCENLVKVVKCERDASRRHDGQRESFLC